MANCRDRVVPDEETPLLTPALEGKGSRKPTPLPRLQLAIVMLVALAEPMSATVIAPFVNQLISELDITGGDDAKVGYYVGVLLSLFFVCEATTTMHWGRLSDRVGRKPVLLVGLAGTTISLICFGLSRSFWVLVVARCIQGFMNGNSGVMKSMIAEMTDSTNMAQAFAFLPAVWATGITIAPLLGGTLQHPHHNFPDHFQNLFWSKYPYFLPCFAAALVAAFSFIVTLIFLEETVAKQRSHHRTRTSSEATLVDISSDVAPADKVLSLSAVLTPRVILAVANYCMLAILDISVVALQPLVFASPVALGGLALDPPTIGLMLGAFGLSNGVFQALFFAPLVRRFGLKAVFTTAIAAFIPVFALFPAANGLARATGGNAALWAILGLLFAWNVVYELAFGSIFLYVASSAPNRRSLGATNGISQLSASITRAIGPMVASSLFAYSVDHNVVGGYMVYLVLMAMVCVALRVASYLPKHPWERDDS